METLLKRWIGKPVRVVRRERADGVIYSAGVLEGVSSGALALSSVCTGWAANSTLRALLKSCIDADVYPEATETVIPFVDILNVSLLGWLDSTCGTVKVER